MSCSLIPTLRAACAVVAVVAASACTPVSPIFVDAAVDAGSQDGAIDAAPDGASAGPTRVEPVGGAARLSGGRYSVEVTAGVAADPATVGGGALRVEAGTPVHP